jgi:DedD protein
MGLFSFGKKDDAAPRRRGAETGSGRSSQGSRVERRSRRPDRSGDAEAMLLDPTLPEKQRARRRLVGAIALVVAAIVILPMVLDSHPKPVTDDIAIDIPSHPTSANGGAATRDDAEDTQAGVAPDNPAAASGLGLPAAVSAGASAAAPVAAQTAQNTANAPVATTAAPATSGKTAQAAQSTQTAQTQTQSQPSRTSKPAAQTQAPATTTAANTATGSQSARSAAPNQPSQSATNGTGTTAAADAPPAAPPGARYAVQLGAFANDATARNWVTKLKAAGVPAYTEQRKQADGSMRTLLRAGPFADRAAATDAIAKVRGAGLMSGANGGAE